MAMWIVILLTLLAFLILEYIIPFGRNVKWIENSSKAYYQAQSWIEQALLFQSLDSTPTWASQNIPFIVWKPLAHSYDIAGNGSILPPVWEWNSEYDDRSIDGDDFSWNTITLGQPIQLEIGNLTTDIDWNAARFHFRIPNIDTNRNTLQWNDNAIINWQIWSSNDLLSASGSWITADDINDYDWDGIEMKDFIWSTLEDRANNTSSIEDFYDAQCLVWKCTLKFSVVNSLLLEANSASFEATQLPYLEWRFDFGSNVPLRYANIKSEWKSYGFKKNINLKIPQQTIVEALDFTVFQ